MIATSLEREYLKRVDIFYEQCLAEHFVFVSALSISAVIFPLAPVVNELSEKNNIIKWQQQPLNPRGQGPIYLPTAISSSG